MSAPRILYIGGTGAISTACVARSLALGAQVTVLNRIAEAYAETPDLPVLMTAPYFAEVFTRGQASWRRVVVTAAQAGIPAPAFSSSLSYYDGIRADRLPAALVQGQRDFFGAHTYKRIDKEGTFHTLWSGDRTEIEAEDTH